jgi:hypothetical protein
MWGGDHAYQLSVIPAFLILEGNKYLSDISLKHGLTSIYPNNRRGITLHIDSR